jgi:hypothetical protein
MLYRFLEKHGKQTPKSHDRIPWKHQSSPPSDSQVSSGFRAVYLFSDPRNAVVSIFRRGIQHFHLSRLSDAVGGWGVATRDPESWPLSTFLDHGVDLFDMETQYDNWTNADRDYPIMILRFEALWDRLPEVFAFLGIPSESVRDFPSYRERHSNWKTDLAAEEREKLNHIYGNLAQRIHSRRDLVIL